MKDKDIKIYEQKINIYSEFVQKMWGMLDDGEIFEKELISLRNHCFQKLVFYLNERAQVIEISEEIKKIEIGKVGDATKFAMAKITNVLQKNLDENMEVKQGEIERLYNSFNRNEDEKVQEESTAELQSIDSDNNNGKSSENNITYWHFNMFGDAQKEAFKNGNWRLSLLENGEDWRTNLLKQVKPDDVIFLF